MGVTIITLSIDDSFASEQGCSVACMLSPWFFAIGFVFAFSSLFAKEWRINKLFHNPSMKRMKVETKDVIVPFVVLLGLNVLLLSLWTGLSPLVWDRSYVGTLDKYGRDLESVGMCVGEVEGWAPYVGILLFINMAMVALASFQAYRARRISVEYSESKWVAIILLAILQSFAIGLPLIALSNGNPTSNFVVNAGLVVILCITFLLAMFVPKFWQLQDEGVEVKRKQRLKEEAEQRREEFLRRTGTTGTPATTTTQNCSRNITVQHSGLGAKVLFHPKTHKDELEALKEELHRTQQQLLQRHIT
jgi:hypothetical protein